MLREKLIEKGLSNREAEVTELVSKGLSNKECANALFVTEKTVKFHLTNIYKKMNVKSRAQLIVWCLPYLVATTEDRTVKTVGENNVCPIAQKNVAPMTQPTAPTLPMGAGHNPESAA